MKCCKDNSDKEITGGISRLVANILSLVMKILQDPKKKQAITKKINKISKDNLGNRKDYNLNRL